MKNPIKDIHIKGNKIAGVEVIVASEDSLRYNIVVLQKSKGKLFTLEKKSNLHRLEDAEDILKNGLPICLGITGKGTIHRKLQEEDTGQANQGPFINRVFPNASPDDFYVQHKEADEDNIYVSLVRRTLLNTILEKFDMYKVHIVDIQLGPYVAEHIIPLIRKDYDKFIDTSTHQLEIENSGIVSYKPLSEEPFNKLYHIGDEPVYSEELIAYACGFYSLVMRDFKNEADDEDIQARNKEFENFRKFRFAGIIVLLFFFLALLINYLVFDHYNKKQAVLSEKVSKFNNLLTRTEQLNKELQDKKTLLEETGLLMQSRLSFYADRLAACMPYGVVLNEVNVNPVKKNKLKEQKIEFTRNIILVKGMIKNTTNINTWIKEIKRYNWVKKLNVLSYTKEEDKKGEFVLEIQVMPVKNNNNN